jgi:Mg/Co/Ni transporter MgtE
LSADPLVVAFARKSPAAFAQALGRGSPEEASALVQELPKELAMRVAAALPPGHFPSIATLELDILIGWLERSDADTGVAFVSRLPREKGLALVEALENPSLRRRLGRALRYPEHCVGARLTGDVQRVLGETTVAHLLTQLRAIESDGPPRVVLLDSQGKYHSVLSLWRLALEEDPARRVRDFGSAVTALRPETSIADAHADPQWDDHLWLPVADFNDRVIGSVERKSLATEMEAAPSEPLIDSALLLGQEYLRVSSALLDSLLRGWSRL